MIKAKIGIPKDTFDEFRTLPTRHKRLFNAQVRTVVAPAGKRKVKELFAVDPGPVVHPFKFSTDLSRRAFFATKGFGRGLGAPRTGIIINAWTLEITRQGEKSYMLLVNPAAGSEFVYGSPTQRQVPGHARTGYGRNFKAKTQQLQDFVVDELINAWYYTGQQAAKGMK